MSIMNIKEKIEKFKQLSLNVTTTIVSILAYWIGVSFSYLLWKLSTFFKKENKTTYWSELEEREEDYKSQY